MQPRWAKVFRDLLQSRTRTVMTVLGIAIGVCGFGSVLTTYSILTRELNSTYLATNPASATLWVGPIDDGLAASVRGFRGIGDMEERRTVPVRMRVGNGEWHNGSLFVIKDFNNIRISTLKPQRGKWPPGDGEILIERDAMGVARADIGDDIQVSMPGGAEQQLRITGTTYDVGQAQARMEQHVYGYITSRTLQLLGEQPYFDQMKVVLAENKFDEEQVRNTIGELKKWLEASGHPVQRMEIPRPGKHPHADLTGAMLLFQSAFGLFALVVSGLLAANMISAMMAGQIRQIGMMKAIGARSRQVMLLYFAGVLMLGAMALVIALPVCMAAGRALAGMLSRFLNMDIESFSVPLWVPALESAIALLVPLLASLYPVYRGSRITVLESISDYGVDPNVFGAGAFERLLSSVGGLARPLLLSLRNAFRRKARLVLTLCALASGGVVFMAALNVRASFLRTSDVMFQSTKYDLSVSMAEPYTRAEVEAVVRRTPGVALVESWVGSEATTAGRSGSPGNPFGIVAPPPGTRMLALKIIEGRDLRSEDRNALVINNRLARTEPAMKVGATVVLSIKGRSSTWRIVGLARQPFAGPAAYGDYPSVLAATQLTGKTRNVRIVTQNHDKPSIDAIKVRLEQSLEQAGFHATSNTSMADLRRGLDEHNSMIYTFLIIMSLLIVAVGGTGLVTLMSINVLERRREIGVLRTLGATRNAILAIVMAEGSVIAAMSWFIALIPSSVVSKALGNFVANMMFRTDLDYAFDATGVAVWLVLMIVFGAAASALPAWKASRISVRQAIDYE